MDAGACRVFEIARGTTHDGPGLRTTVFLAGCPLRCGWCQNPEGIGALPDVAWEADRCIGCLECVAACPAGALAAVGGRPVRDRDACARCGACADACPSRAMAFTSREWTTDALLAEVLRDREYYRSSGGGVTLSGGEPLARPDFAAGFLARLRAEGVPAALDTCGWAPREVFDAAAAGADLVLYDLKLMDDALHRRHTGRPNGPVLANAAAAAEAVRARRSGPRPLRLWVRTPLIPGATADAANVAAVGAFIRDRLAGAVERWELCAFNGACAAKYRKLGIAWQYEKTPLMARGEVERLREAALGTGIEPERLAVTGLVAGTKAVR